MQMRHTLPPRRPPPGESFTQRLTFPFEIGNLVADLRRMLGVDQDELARRIGVGRHWIAALERGRPTLQLGLVMRTFEALGLVVTVHPEDPPPAWITRALLDEKARRDMAAMRRKAARRSKREVARLGRIAPQSTRGTVDLE